MKKANEVIKLLEQENKGTSQMIQTVDNFVRFLIGDPKAAVKKLTDLKNAGVSLKGVKADEYNQLYGNLFKDIMSAIDRNLGTIMK